MVSCKKIAILGATSHIAKGLIVCLRSSCIELHLFARSPDRVETFLKEIGNASVASINTFDVFPKMNFDVIINCVGLGNPGDPKTIKEDMFETNEQFDNLSIEYIKKRSSTQYIYLSSGAAYCNNFTVSADDTTHTQILVNKIPPEQFYGITKLYTEAKHRALKELSIIDIRIFSYFSRFIDENSRYLITDVIKAIREKRMLKTSRENVVRDYVGPEDLVQFIQKCLNNSPLNGSYDLYSKMQVKKMEILNFFAKEYSLTYSVTGDSFSESIGGKKNNYYSNSRKAESIGYFPRYSSMETIAKEASILLK